MKAYFKKLFSVFVFLSCIFCFCGVTGAFEINESMNERFVPKVSVVVPVYNVSNYLDEALNSVENQTYKNMEIICINDGSTDNSLKILESHAQKDGRIKIINQENKGVSEARNVGIRAAIGKYIYFFDPDDVLAPYIMEKSVNLLEKHGADMLEFKYLRRSYCDKVNFPKCSYSNSKVRIYEYKAKNNPFRVFNGTIKVWACVYKRSFLNENSIWFNEDIRISEDLLFNFMCRAYIKKMIKYDGIGYWYRVHRPGSAVTVNNCKTRIHVENNLKVIREIIAFRDRLRFKSKDIDEYFASYILNLVHGKCVNIKNVRSSTDRRQLSNMAYVEIGKNFVEKYHIKLSKADKKKLENLKCGFKSRVWPKKARK